MVADLKGRRDHGIVRRALTALLRLEHRGARGSEVNTGDGAGILLQIPDAFYRAVVPFELPAEGAYAAGLAFLPTDADRRDHGRDRRARGRGGPRRAGLARAAHRRRRRRPRAHRAPGDAHDPPAVRRGRGGRDRPRAGAPHLLPAQARRARHRRLLPLALAAHHRLQGDAVRAPGRGVLPGPLRRARGQRAGARALPVLHQHVPRVAARAPLPLRRAQRRDQHAARQPQLDGRPRGAAVEQADPGRPRPPLPHRHPGRERLRHVRRGARAAAPRRPHPCRTRC